jgi:hypothetical protein
MVASPLPNVVPQVGFAVGLALSGRWIRSVYAGASEGSIAMTAKTKTIDPPRLFEKLKAEVIEQAGFVRPLRAWQETRVHSTALLLLELDRLTAQSLRGEAIDPKSVASIGEQLERLQNPSRGGDSPEAHDRADAEATAELDRLITGILEQREFDGSEAMQREELAAIAAAMPENVTAKLADASDPDAPPPNNVKTVYIDHDLIEPDPTKPPTPTPVTPGFTPRSPRHNPSEGAFQQFWRVP